MSARPELDVRVFVVWEPVIVTDVAPPTTHTLARIHDARSRQYWDEGRVLSTHIIHSVTAAPDRYRLTESLDAGSIVWDTVALFRPALRWDDEFPVPVYYGCPVVSSVTGLASALARRPESDPSTP